MSQNKISFLHLLASIVDGILLLCSIPQLIITIHHILIRLLPGCRRVASHCSTLLDALLIFKTWFAQRQADLTTQDCHRSEEVAPALPTNFSESSSSLTGHHQIALNGSSSVNGAHEMATSPSALLARAKQAEDQVGRLRTACLAMRVQLESGLRFKAEVGQLKRELELTKVTIDHYKSMIDEGKLLRQELHSELATARKEASNLRAKLANANSQQQASTSPTTPRPSSIDQQDRRFTQSLAAQLELTRSMQQEAGQLRETIRYLTEQLQHSKQRQSELEQRLLSSPTSSPDSHRRCRHSSDDSSKTNSDKRQAKKKKTKLDHQATLDREYQSNVNLHDLINQLPLADDADNSAASSSTKENTTSPSRLDDNNHSSSSSVNTVVDSGSNIKPKHTNPSQSQDSSFFPTSMRTRLSASSSASEAETSSSFQSTLPPESVATATEPHSELLSRIGNFKKQTKQGEMICSCTGSRGSSMCYLSHLKLDDEYVHQTDWQSPLVDHILSGPHITDLDAPLLPPVKQRRSLRQRLVKKTSSSTPVSSSKQQHQSIPVCDVDSTQQLSESLSPVSSLSLGSHRSCRKRRQSQSPPRSPSPCKQPARKPVVVKRSRLASSSTQSLNTTIAPCQSPSPRLSSPCQAPPPPDKPLVAQRSRLSSTTTEGSHDSNQQPHHQPRELLSPISSSTSSRRSCRNRRPQSPSPRSPSPCQSPSNKPYVAKQSRLDSSIKDSPDSPYAHCPPTSLLSLLDSHFDSHVISWFDSLTTPSEATPSTLDQSDSCLDQLIQNYFSTNSSNNVLPPLLNQLLLSNRPCSLQATLTIIARWFVYCLSTNLVASSSQPSTLTELELKVITLLNPLLHQQSSADDTLDMAQYLLMVWLPLTTNPCHLASFTRLLCHLVSMTSTESDNKQESLLHLILLTLFTVKPLDFAYRSLTSIFTTLSSRTEWRSVRPLQHTSAFDALVATTNSLAASSINSVSFSPSLTLFQSLLAWWYVARVKDDTQLKTSLDNWLSNQSTDGDGQAAINRRLRSLCLFLIDRCLGLKRSSGSRVELLSSITADTQYRDCLLLLLTATCLVVGRDALISAQQQTDTKQLTRHQQRIQRQQEQLGLVGWLLNGRLVPWMNQCSKSFKSTSNQPTYSSQLHLFLRLTTFTIDLCQLVGFQLTRQCSPAPSLNRHQSFDNPLSSFKLPVHLQPLQHLVTSSSIKLATQLLVTNDVTDDSSQSTVILDLAIQSLRLTSISPTTALNSALTHFNKFVNISGTVPSNYVNSSSHCSILWPSLTVRETVECSLDALRIPSSSASSNSAIDRARVEELSSVYSQLFNI